MPAVGQLQASEFLRLNIDESGLEEAVWEHLQWGHSLQASSFLSVLDDEVQATRWARNRWWDETYTQVQLWELDSAKVLLETIIFRVNDLRTHFRLPVKRDTSGEYMVVNFIPEAVCVNIREVGQPCYRGHVSSELDNADESFFAMIEEMNAIDDDEDEEDDAEDRSYS